MSVEAVILDLGGVVLEVDPRATCRTLGLHDAPTQDRFIAAFREGSDHHDFERGLITPSQFFAGLRNRFPVPLNQDLAAAWNKLVMAQIPGAEMIFDLCAGRVPVFALTNTNTTHFDYITREFPILKRFNRILTSFELGERKPGRRIFELAAEELSIQPERTVFIDDSADNVAAARAVGYQSFRTANDPRKTVELLRRELVTCPGTS